MSELFEEIELEDVELDRIFILAVADDEDIGVAG